MITLTDVDNATQLRRRIAKLKARIDGERTELQETVQELRHHFTPAMMARQVVGSLMNEQPAKDLKEELTGLAWQVPLRLLTNVLVRDPRAAFLIKNVAPVAIHFAPQIWEKASLPLPTRIKVYGMLRMKVMKWRTRFREVDEDASWFI